MALQAAGLKEIILRPDLPAGEEWFTPPADNVHRKSDTEKWVRKVQRPTLEVYEAARPNGTAVVVAPGGGFTILAIEHEGRDVARWLNDRGVTAFVLRYRVGLESREVSQKAAIEDGLLAVKTVRQRAGEWKLDSKRIGVMGFSAGGYLTVGVATQYTPESLLILLISHLRGGSGRLSAPGRRATNVHCRCLRRQPAHDHHRHRPAGCLEEGQGARRVARLPRRRPWLRHEQELGKSCNVWTDLLGQWMSRMKLLEPR